MAINGARVDNLSVQMEALALAPSAQRPDQRVRQRSEPFGTVARIKAVIMEHHPLEPWHPAGVERIAGSGWFVRLPWERDDGPNRPPRFVVTCNHCVEGVKARDGMAVQTSSTGDALWRARVAAVVPEIDAAIIELLATPGLDPSALVAWPLGDDRADVAVDDVVRVYGYPLGQERLKTTESHVNGREGGLLQLDGSINFGDSGGPVVKDDRVVGWVTQGVPEANAVSFAQPVSLLLAALFALRPLPALSANDWMPYGGLPPPAHVLRRGGLGCALYVSNNDRLVILGARCPDAERGDPRMPTPPSSTDIVPIAPDPWGGGGPRYTGTDFGPSGAAAHVVVDPMGGESVTGGGRVVSRRRQMIRPPRGIVSEGLYDGDADDDDGGSGDNGTESQGCDCPSGAIMQWVSRRSDLARAPFRAQSGDVLCSLVLPLVPPGGYAPLIDAAVERDDGSAPSPADIADALASIVVPVVLTVGNDGGVVLPWTRDRMDVDRALLLVPWGMRVGARVYNARDRRSTGGVVSLVEATAIDGFYRPYRPFEPDDYEAFGGIVVGPLTADVIDAFPPLAERLSPDEREQPRLVVLRALIGGVLNAGPSDDGGANIREGSIIESVNGRRVATMDDYREALRNPYRGAYFTIDTNRGRGDAVSMATLLAAESDLAAQYGYPLSATWDYYQAMFSST
jgi:S1-C subfamily serine protease